MKRRRHRQSRNHQLKNLVYPEIPTISVMDIKHDLEFLCQNRRIPSALGAAIAFLSSERLGHSWGITWSRKARGRRPISIFPRVKSSGPLGAQMEGSGIVVVCLPAWAFSCLVSLHDGHG
jgi:hypothetical protein